MHGPFIWVCVRLNEENRGLMLRLLGYLFAFCVVVFLLGSAYVAYEIDRYSQGLTSHEVLKDYQPPVMTRVHAANGQLMAEYARERRLYLPIQAVPARVVQAFISAEDKNFFKHHGLDYEGLARAVIVNVRNYMNGRRLIGASTITQQVAKNFLLTSERSLDRKIKEALLSRRIEQTFTKYQILELYLNEIYLGIGSYGVAAASLNYFDKSVHELSLPEMAYLAALPKAPNNYHPFRHAERAIERRNYVIDRMIANGYVKPEEGEAAKKQPLQVSLRDRGSQIAASEYFAEEVRRVLYAKYGEEQLYEGGLSVRTTLDTRMQNLARNALRNGLLSFDKKRGWRGPVNTIDVAGDWGQPLAKVKLLEDLDDWRMAVVLGADKAEATIGLRPALGVDGKLVKERETGVLKVANMKWARWAASTKRKTPKKMGVSDILQPGDVIYVQQIDKAKPELGYRLQQVPGVDGAIVAMDPYTGRVLALVGGFSFVDSQFNRATQAKRQPGSSFKPFVYASALDNGYTPASVVMDAPIKLKMANGKIWNPSNYSKKYYGPQTLRLGIERSRNVMTVRLAKDMGMPLVAEYARRFGIYDNMLPVLSMSLGAGETTVLRMTAAYAMLANGGRKVTPTLIDRIQDRYGRTIYRHDQRKCALCAAEKWQGQAEPTLVDEREQVLDPMTAYQITSMMEGVVKRGTGVRIKKIVNRPLAGKTGTSNDAKDAWFMGYSPDLAVGVFVGYDTPKAMGRGATGGELAAPIFGDFMKQALAGQPKIPFRVPRGIKLVPINRKTGLRSSAGGGGVILEAFKPGTNPPDNYSVIGFENLQNGEPPAPGGAIVTGTGGLY